jgi:hypothetical protein
MAMLFTSGCQDSQSPLRGYVASSRGFSSDAHGRVSGYVVEGAGRTQKCAELQYGCAPFSQSRTKHCQRFGPTVSVAPSADASFNNVRWQSPIWLGSGRQAIRSLAPELQGQSALQAASSVWQFVFKHATHPGSVAPPSPPGIAASGISTPLRSTPVGQTFGLFCGEGEGLSVPHPQRAVIATASILVLGKVRIVGTFTIGKWTGSIQASTWAGSSILFAMAFPWYPRT